MRRRRRSLSERVTYALLFQSIVANHGSDILCFPATLFAIRRRLQAIAPQNPTHLLARYPLVPPAQGAEIRRGQLAASHTRQD